MRLIGFHRFCGFLIFFMPLTYLFAADFEAIFETVPQHYKGVFAERAKELFDKNIASLEPFVKTHGSKSFFITHDYLNKRQEQVLIQIAAQLNIAGIRTLLDLVDNRPGSNLSVHQFNDRIYEPDVDAIIVACSGVWKNEEEKNNHQSERIIFAQNKKRNPLMLLGLEPLDKDLLFPATLLAAEHKFIRMTNLEANFELHNLIKKIYEIFRLIYNGNFASEISNAENQLVAQLKAIAGNEELLRQLYNEKVAQENMDEEKWKEILGLNN